MTVGNIIQIVGLNLVLSGDNALSIALSAKDLEKKLKRKAIFWGSLIASGMLIALTFIANFILLIPFTALIGGLFLLKIAYGLPGEIHEEAEEEAKDSAGGHASIKTALKQIVITNMIMSFDNALAMASAARGNYSLIVIGVTIGSLIVMIGGHAVAWLLHKYAWLVYVGAGILAHTASSMIFSDRNLNKWAPLEAYSFWGSVMVAVVVVSLSYVFNRTRSKKTSVAVK